MRVGIAGAGLMGRLMGWQLSALGWSVTLFDRDISGKKSAAYAAAGLLSPYAELKTEELVFRLGRAGITAWEALLPNFKNRSWFHKKGSIVVAHSEDVHQLNNFKFHLQNKLNGFLKMNLKKFEMDPEFQCREGILLSEEAVIDSRKLLAVLKDALDLKKTTWHDRTPVIQVKPHSIVTKDKTYTFDWVFDCRGYGGGEHFSDLRAVRGELIYVLAREVNINRPLRLLHPRYPLYIVPRPQSIYVVGASEIEANDDSPISVRTCLELLSAAYSLHRGFGEARILETSVGLRPALSNHLPRIIIRDGMMAINGLYRHGFLFAPILLQEIIHFLNNPKHQSIYPELIQ